MLQAREDRLCSHSEKVALTKEVVDHTERVRNSSGSELVSSPESHKDPDCSVSVSRGQFYQRNQQKEARHAGPMCMPLIEAANRYHIQHVNVGRDKEEEED